ncbi:MarR family winged helix-turn-helix transcriptional regulator [Nocardia sp. alder85J]|uniref:MarR family winged helix-turn-helix transcriptional regulator n=1 Tax=Nocardia sp. alder85J TaxID=2862949 RepID=UPI001CD7BC51|nr:MarR family transcriptional regulator [Nocardia sp. alder85J]MCX4098391.1 MarR family transcriptional regulator [Nocardia sp. alder85J]
MNYDRQRLIDELLQAGRESSRLSVLFRAVAVSGLAITASDGECLDFLLDAGNATAGEIAAQTNLTTGAVTAMIRRLERRGYVVSERDPADRRRVVVRAVPEKLLTSAGIYARYAARSRELLAAYTDAELTFLTAHYRQTSTIYREFIDESSAP